MCVGSAQGAACAHDIARLGCKGDIVGIGKANSYPGCIDWLRKCYFYLERGLFLAGKAV